MLHIKGVQKSNNHLFLSLSVASEMCAFLCWCFDLISKIIGYVVIDEDSWIVIYKCD